MSKKPKDTPSSLKRKRLQEEKELEQKEKAKKAKITDLSPEDIQHIEWMKQFDKLFIQPLKKNKGMITSHESEWLKLAKQPMWYDGVKSDELDVHEQTSPALYRYKLGSGMINHIARTNPQSVQSVTSIQEGAHDTYWDEDADNEETYWAAWNYERYRDEKTEDDKKKSMSQLRKEKKEKYHIYIAEIDWLFDHRCGITTDYIMVYRGVSIVESGSENKMTQENQAIHQWYDHNMFKWLEQIAFVNIDQEKKCPDLKSMWNESVIGARSRLQNAIFSEDAFCSTSLSFKLALSFANKNKRDFVMAILVPPGTHYLMPKYTPPLTASDTEYEVLFKRGTRLEALFNARVCTTYREGGYYFTINVLCCHMLPD